MVEAKKIEEHTIEDVENAEKDLTAHKEEFEAIVKRYELFHEERAGMIADFLTTLDGGSVSAEGFAAQFGMNRAEAVIFLSWINVGIKFKEASMDGQATPENLENIIGNNSK